MQKQYQVLFYFQQKKNTSIWNKTPAFASWEQKWKFSETGACSEFQSFKIVRKKNFLSSKQSFLEKFSSRNFFSNSCFWLKIAKISAGNKNKLVFKICFQSLSALSPFLLKTELRNLIFFPQPRLVRYRDWISRWQGWIHVPARGVPQVGPCLAGGTIWHLPTANESHNSVPPLLSPGI